MQRWKTPRPSIIPKVGKHELTLVTKLLLCNGIVFEAPASCGRYRAKSLPTKLGSPVLLLPLLARSLPRRLSSVPPPRSRTPPPRSFADKCVPKEGSPVRQRGRSLEVRWGSAGFQPVRLAILPRHSEDLGRMPKPASKMLALPNQTESNRKRSSKGPHKNNRSRICRWRTAGFHRVPTFRSMLRLSPFSANAPSPR